MPSRLIALLVLLAVLPTAELAEQTIHVVEHVLEAEVPDHSAHHDQDPGDEHGCTGLVHLCSCHQAQVTAASVVAIARAVEVSSAIPVRPPATLADLTSLEPAHRPPIA